jgi:corrinoid protein of di/trimethylamine methyltransferase
MYDELAKAVLGYDADKVVETTKKALARGLSATDILEKGLAKGLKTIGKKFQNGELFLMHLVASGEAVKKALSEILEPELIKSKTERRSLGKVVLGTVSGDIHDIGKNILGAMLLSAGFEVYDLGKDVPVEEFVKKTKETNADIVAASALLSTTMLAQQELVEALVSEGLRDNVKIMIGGAPVTEEWAKEIGADGYGEDAVQAVEVAKKLTDKHHSL